MAEETLLHDFSTHKEKKQIIMSNNAPPPPHPPYPHHPPCFSYFNSKITLEKNGLD